MKIKDLTNGKIYEYGADRHHALVISGDGRSLTFEHLQNGRGSAGGYGTYLFVDDDDEIIPCETEQYSRHGADSYFNIGGFNKGITPCYLGGPCEYQNEDINTDTESREWNISESMARSIIEKLWNYARNGEGTWDELVKEIGLSDDEFHLLMSIFT